MYALRLGAVKVDACDVQPAFVEFVSSVVQARGLPVTVSGTSFDKLCPGERKANIVLFMELLHRVVSQGLELRKVIHRLAELTEQILYMEFPWSVTEPSMQKQTKLTEETYSADAVLDELTRYFTNVRIVRFMRYMGFESRSQRVLIEARGKRPEACILAQLPGAYSLDVALSRGCNESYLLTSARGPLVAKLPAPESPLLKIFGWFDGPYSAGRAERDSCRILPEAGTEESRPATRDDVTLAIAKSIAWFGAARRTKWYSVMQEQVRRLQTGLMEAIKFQGSVA